MFKNEFTHVKGVSDVRRLPRLGKIRLGVKAVSQKSGKEYPKEVNYFVVPPEVAKEYGEKPTALDVMFPINDPGTCFPQAYKYYGTSKGLKCLGNGVKAREALEDGTMQERDCPCEKLKTTENPKGECCLRGTLMVVLPKVNCGGVYQLDIGSYHSIVDVNSGIDYIRAIMQERLGIDRFAWIACTLERVERETHHDGQKQKHYTLVLRPNLTLETLESLRTDNRIVAPPAMALPAPEDVNPKLDPGAVIVVDDGEPEAPADAAAPDPVATHDGDDELPFPPGGQESPPAPEHPGRDVAMQFIRLKWTDMANKAGISVKDAVSQLLTLWLATFYGENVRSLQQLPAQDLDKLYQVFNGKHKDSKANLAKVQEWITLQRGLVVKE